MFHQENTAKADRRYDEPKTVEIGVEIIELTRENELTDAQALGALVYALVNRYMDDLYCGEQQDIEFLISVVRDEASRVAERMDKLFDSDQEYIDVIVEEEPDESEETSKKGCFSDYNREQDLSNALYDLIEDIESYRESEYSRVDFEQFYETFVMDLRLIGWSRKEIRRFRYLMSEIADGSYDDMTMLEIDALVRYAVCFRDIPLSGEFVSDEQLNWYRTAAEQEEDD